MPAPLAHVVTEGAVVSEYVHAAGGLHHAVALAAAGCVAMLGRGDPRAGAALFGTALAAGVALGIAAPAGAESLGVAGVLAFGVVLVLLRWAPGWTAGLVAAVFGACYGLVQTQHLLATPDAAGVGTVVAVAVATVGSYGVGLTLGWVAGEARATRRTAGGLGAAMLLAAGVPLLVR